MRLDPDYRTVTLWWRHRLDPGYILVRKIRLFCYNRLQLRFWFLSISGHILNSYIHRVTSGSVTFGERCLYFRNWRRVETAGAVRSRLVRAEVGAHIFDTFVCSPVQEHDCSDVCSLIHLPQITNSNVEQLPFPVIALSTRSAVTCEFWASSSLSMGVGRLRPTIYLSVRLLAIVCHGDECTENGERSDNFWYVVIVGKQIRQVTSAPTPSSQWSNLTADLLVAKYSVGPPACRQSAANLPRPSTSYSAVTVISWFTPRRRFRLSSLGHELSRTIGLLHLYLCVLYYIKVLCKRIGFMLTTICLL